MSKKLYAGKIIYSYRAGLANLYSTDTYQNNIRHSILEWRMNIISQNLNDYLRLSQEIQRFNLTHTANYMISVQYILLCLVLYFVFVLFCSLFSVCLFVCSFLFYFVGFEGFLWGGFVRGVFVCFCLFCVFCLFLFLFCFVLFCFYLFFNKEQRYVPVKNTKISMNLAWPQTPETGSGLVAFTDLAAQLKMQNYVDWYTFCHL